MYKTIIVPIDIGHMERAESMIDSARQLGPEANIILANAVETLPSHIMAEIPVDMIDDAKKRAEEKLEGLLEKAGPNASVKMLEGHAASAILDLAEDSNADVIVIASHKPGWQDYLIGSTAARVVRHAKCAVFVIR
ncbi:MAG: universal stress protein [Nitratireductor sp.]|nr:universal stress protein [Nitratireductor sp.]